MHWIQYSNQPYPVKDQIPIGATVQILSSEPDYYDVFNIQQRLSQVPMGWIMSFRNHPGLTVKQSQVIFFFQNASKFIYNIFLTRAVILRENWSRVLRIVVLSDTHCNVWASHFINIKHIFLNHNTIFS